MKKHVCLSMLFVASVGRTVGAADLPPPASPPSVSSLGDGARAYLNELLGRIRDLEQRLEGEQTARLAERAESARLLEQARTDGAGRLETFSGELRSREHALDAAKGEVRRLHDSGAVCGRALEVATKEAAEVATQRDGRIAELQDVSRQIAATRAEVRNCSDAAARQKGEAAEVTTKLRAELEASRTSAQAIGARLATTQQDLATSGNALAKSENDRAKSADRAAVAETGLAEMTKQRATERQRAAALENALARSRTEAESAREEVKEKARLLAEGQDREKSAQAVAEASGARAKDLSGKVAGLEKRLAEEKVGRAAAEDRAAASDKRVAASREDVKNARAALAARESELGARIAALEHAAAEEAERWKLAGEESARRLAASERVVSNLRTEVEARTKDVASLQEELKAGAGLRAAEQQKSAAQVAQVAALRDELVASKAALSDARAAEAKAVEKAEETRVNVVALSKRDEERASRIKTLEDERRDDRVEAQKRREALEEKERLLDETRSEAERARAAAQGQEKQVAELARRVTTLDKQLADAVSARSKGEEAAQENSRRLAASQGEAKRLADALSMKDAEIKGKAQELASVREEAAAKLKAVDSDAASRLAASEKSVAAIRSDFDSRMKQVVDLKQQVEAAKKLADTLSAKDAELKAKTEELASVREEAAAKLTAVDTEAASKLAASEKALASTSSDLDSHVKEIENLKRQVAEAQNARQVATSKDEGTNASTLQADLEKTRAEVVRLNDENVEQQALIDELSSARRSSPEARPAKSRSHRDEATRARKAPPIAQVSRKGGDGVAHGSRAEAGSVADELAQALSRREILERTIEKLKGSPADSSAPGKAAEMQAELAAINKEVLRLTVLVSDLPSHPR